MRTKSLFYLLGWCTEDFFYKSWLEPIKHWSAAHACRCRSIISQLQHSGVHDCRCCPENNALKYSGLQIRYSTCWYGRYLARHIREYAGLRNLRMLRIATNTFELRFLQYSCYFSQRTMIFLVVRFKPLPIRLVCKLGSPVMICIQMPVRGTSKSKLLDNILRFLFGTRMGSRLAAKRPDWQQSVRLAQVEVRCPRRYMRVAS